MTLEEARAKHGHEAVSAGYKSGRMHDVYVCGCALAHLCGEPTCPKGSEADRVSFNFGRLAFVGDTGKAFQIAQGWIGKSVDLDAGFRKMRAA